LRCAARTLACVSPIAAVAVAIASGVAVRVANRPSNVLTSAESDMTPSGCHTSAFGPFLTSRDVRFESAMRTKTGVRQRLIASVTTRFAEQPDVGRRRVGLRNTQRFQCCVWTSVSSAHPKEPSKAQSFRLELPHKINDVEFCTNFAKSGALERMGRRETKTAVCRASPVGSFRRRCSRSLGFSRSAAGPEKVVAAGNGGGLETEIQRSPNFRGFYCLPKAPSKNTGKPRRRRRCGRTA
jgi:hypothetical protein